MAQAAATVAAGVGQFGDTTLTKVFVGGLAWATQKEGMRSYFEQFGEILEAVVITDKNTGRSKGYGFVTFREPDAAMRACFDPYPVIDGRRANCNLAYLGVHKSKTAPTTLKPYVGGGRNMQMRVMKSTDQLMGSGGGGGMSFADHGIQQGIPAYNVYGYSPHFSDYGYPLSYYQAYGGLGAPYQAFGGGATAAAMAGAAGLYPYFQYSPASAAAGGYSTVQMQYPQMYQYAAVATTTASLITATGISGVQQFGGAVAALTPTSTAPEGMTVSVTAPILPTPTPHHYRLIPSHLSAAAAATPEQSLA